MDHVAFLYDVVLVVYKPQALSGEPAGQQRMTPEQKLD